MATDITKEFLQDHFRKRDSITLYKPDGTPVTIVKVYEPVLIAGQYEAYRFRSNEKLTVYSEDNVPHTIVKKYHLTVEPARTMHFDLDCEDLERFCNMMGITLKPNK